MPKWVYLTVIIKVSLIFHHIYILWIENIHKYPSSLWVLNHLTMLRCMLTIMTLEIIADKDWIYIWLECDSTATIACYHPLFINHLGSYMQNCLSFYASNALIFSERGNFIGDSLVNIPICKSLYENFWDLLKYRFFLIGVTNSTPSNFIFLYRAPTFS